MSLKERPDHVRVVERWLDANHPPIANRAALVDGTPGVNIHPELSPAPDS